MAKKIDERIAVIESKFESICDNISKHRDEQRQDFRLVFKKLDELDKRFAGKWVEKVTVGVLIASIAGLAIALLI